MAKIAKLKEETASYLKTFPEPKISYLTSLNREI